MLWVTRWMWHLLWWWSWLGFAVNLILIPIGLDKLAYLGRAAAAAVMLMLLADLRNFHRAMSAICSAVGNVLRPGEAPDA